MSLEKQTEYLQLFLDSPVADLLLSKCEKETLSGIEPRIRPARDSAMAQQREVLLGFVLIS